MIRAAALLVAAIVTLAGCGPAPATTATVTPSAALPTPTPSGSTEPTGTPSSTGCVPYAETTGPWPSDRLTGMRVGAGEGAEDVLEFEFGPASGAGATATVTTRETAPPFTMAGSGATVEVIGSAFYEFRFNGMLIADETGTPTYQGERNLRTGLPWIQQVVLVDESEGVVTFIVGTAGGCPSLETAPAAGYIRFRAGGPVP